MRSAHADGQSWCTRARVSPRGPSSLTGKEDRGQGRESRGRGRGRRRRGAEETVRLRGGVGRAWGSEAWGGCSSSDRVPLRFDGAPLVSRLGRPDSQTDRREGSWLHNPPPLGCVSVQQNPGWHGHRVYATGAHVLAGCRPDRGAPRTELITAPPLSTVFSKTCVWECTYIQWRSCSASETETQPVTHTSTVSYRATGRGAASPKPRKEKQCHGSKVEVFRNCYTRQQTVHVLLVLCRDCTYGIIDLTVSR